MQSRPYSLLIVVAPSDSSSDDLARISCLRWAAPWNQFIKHELLAASQAASMMRRVAQCGMQEQSSYTSSSPRTIYFLSQ